ncbi:glycosyltransferase family 4 protein [Azospirillum doebereinerae]
MTIRILIYCDDHGNGGAAMATHRLALELAGRGHDIRYAQTDKDGRDGNDARIAERSRHGIAHVPIPYDTIRFYKPAIDDVRTPARILTEQRPDLMIASDALVESTLGAKEAAAFLSIPYLAVKHLVLADGLYAHDPAMGERVRRSIAASAGVIAVSEENRGLLAARYPDLAGRFETIHNSVPAPFFAPRDEGRRAAFRRAHAIPDGATAVLTAAAIVARKGFHHQAELLKRLKRAGDLDRFVFVWAGEEDAGYAAPLWRDLCAHGCDGAVRRIGHQGDIPACLDGCDVMLLPSEQEALGLINVEAMAKGVPVIASAVGGIPEAVGDAGVLIPDPTRDPDGAVEAMRRTLLAWNRAPEEALRRGGAGRRRAEALFSTGTMLDRYEAAIRRAVFPPGDYVSPTLPPIRSGWEMPFIAPAPPERLGAAERALPHTRYVDLRFPRMPALPLDRDECHILHAAALGFAGRGALDVGHSFGWVAHHLLAAGMRVDAMDSFFDHPDLRKATLDALPAGSGPRMRLVIGTAAAMLDTLVGATPEPWSLAVIDTRRDGVDESVVLACARHMAEDALLFVLGLRDARGGPSGKAALRALQAAGWQSGLFRTASGLGAAWRGRAVPPPHRPDPAIESF